MADPLYPIVLAAVELKTSAPRSFEDLIKAMESYEAKCIDDLLAAGGEAVVEAQVRARTVRQLKTKLRDCTQLRDTSEKRK